MLQRPHVHVDDTHAQEDVFRRIYARASWVCVRTHERGIDGGREEKREEVAAVARKPR